MDFLKKHRLFFLVLSLFGILIDIFIFKFTSDLVILGLTGLWIGAVIGWRLEGRFSILGALIFLVMCPFLLIIKQEAIAEKAAIWTYMFLVVGVVQQMIELKRGTKGWRDFDGFVEAASKLADLKIDELRKKGARGMVEIMAGLFLAAMEAAILASRKSLAAVKKKVLEIADDMQSSPLLYVFGLAGKFLFSGLEKLGRLISRYWREITLAALAISAARAAEREILFYHEFFQEHFIWQFSQRLLVWLLLFWGLAFSGLFFLKNKWRVLKNRKIFIILFLLLIWQGNGQIFHRARAKFEFKPYILRINPNIASRYMIVKIYGRNFRDLPFESRVLLNNRHQRIRHWSDKLITFEVDPLLSASGDLWVQTRDGSSRAQESNRLSLLTMIAAMPRRSKQGHFGKC